MNKLKSAAQKALAPGRARASIRRMIKEPKIELKNILPQYSAQSERRWWAEGQRRLASAVTSNPNASMDRSAPSVVEGRVAWSVQHTAVESFRVRP